MVSLAEKRKLPRKEITPVLRHLLDQYGNFRALRLKALEALLELGGHKKTYSDLVLSMLEDLDYGFRQLAAKVWKAVARNGMCGRYESSCAALPCTRNGLW
jgi:hypothetical protein